MAKKRIPRNALVRIGKGKKVYRVAVVPRRGVEDGLYYLRPDADHPDAAKRLADAFRWYKADELELVTGHQ
ncbi:Uncharacterised protein [Mycobacteroides abscessus subsp. massiliense]|uniref:hypothetical protein n=1 Tax=Mycobacteroides abscessus TaxID=36809 RepID=UPI0009CF8AE9|nr:hypothetical protein [Mycobacteroides abscessus]SKM82102.1 Uncharacterised protein [Mycobacteroides abscessus subsp. massiliense]SKM98828.1 Uncharacterised protein [Mycobacteroides abscessus subsp. massiliense]SKN77440.1 Uncharacterised protein [Mycobacteroides abscessus subsp. massiliense]SKN95783.1 Uncharacterised protein [Mycobacteroides abscessus subsp. massiliense]SKO22674.1 Uncharacterised protein [Mycobacteroides abscessus subsp. massiliense]